MKTAEKRKELESQGESWPLCGCHDVSMLWRSDPRRSSGGYWYCSVADNAARQQRRAADMERTRELSRRWRTENPDRYRELKLQSLARQASYEGVHARLAVERGPARDYACVDCGETAADWFYEHGAADERTETEGKNAGLRFSLDIDKYEARCRMCHSALDRVERLRR